MLSLTMGATDAFQLNCSEDLPVAYWSRVVGIVAIVFWLLTFIMWIFFLFSFKRWPAKKIKKDEENKENKENNEDEEDKENENAAEDEKNKQPPHQQKRVCYRRDPLQLCVCSQGLLLQVFHTLMFALAVLPN